MTDFTIPTITVSAREYGAGELMIGWWAVFGADHLKIDPQLGGNNLFDRGLSLKPKGVGAVCQPALNNFCRQ